MRLHVKLRIVATPQMAEIKGKVGKIKHINVLATFQFNILFRYCNDKQ